MTIDLVSIGFIAQWIGTFLLIGAYVPQIVKLIMTKNPVGISLLFWLMIATGCTTILGNMIIQDVATAIQVTQALNAVGAWFTLFLVMYYKKKNGDKIEFNPTVFSVILFATAFMVSFSVTHEIQEVGEALQVIGMITLLTAYLPQIYHLYKVKNSDGLSQWLFLILAQGLLLITFNMFATGAPISIIATEFVNVLLILVMCGLSVKYQADKVVKVLNKSIDKKL